VTYSAIMDAGAYGAGRAGAPFNPVTFIKKPQVIVRLCALVSLHNCVFTMRTFAVCYATGLLCKPKICCFLLANWSVQPSLQVSGQ